MSTPSIHAGDIGTVLVVLVTEDGAAADLRGATTKQYIFTDPSGLLSTKTAGFVTDGQDGLLTYTTIANDFPTAGTWRWQARLTWPGPSRDFHTEIGNLEVLPNLT